MEEIPNGVRIERSEGRRAGWGGGREGRAAYLQKKMEVELENDADED